MVTMCTRPLSVISLDELAAQGRLDELKFRLEIDLADLAILPPINSGFVSSVQAAIRDMGERRYFPGINWCKYCHSSRGTTSGLTWVGSSAAINSREGHRLQKLELDTAGSNSHPQTVKHTSGFRLLCV